MMHLLKLILGIKKKSTIEEERHMGTSPHIRRTRKKYNREIAKIRREARAIQKSAKNITSITEKIAVATGTCKKQ